MPLEFDQFLVTKGSGTLDRVPLVFILQINGSPSDITIFFKKVEGCYS